MKILVLGALNGEVNLINEYVKDTNVDSVLCVGNFGIHYRGFGSDFPDYIEGRKKFTVPVYVMRGTQDNVSLCEDILKQRIDIDKFIIIGDGWQIDIGSNVKVGGTGGSYSPVAYKKEKLIGNDKRHFNKQIIDGIKRKSYDILLMNDLIDECTKKKVVFSVETYNLFDTVKPKYCFVGKYDWWGCSRMEEIPMGLIVIPNAKKGYVTLDTETWDSKVVRFDIEEENG